MNLILSIAALLLGPVIYALGRRNHVARQILDGFIFITIAGIICVNIIPEALTTGGTVAIAFLAFGIAFPIVIERGFHGALHEAHILVLIVAALGLIVHALIDGIALLPTQGGDLAHAVILHRLPIGMAIWWSLRPNLGLPVAIAAFATISIATAASYILGGPMVELAEARSIAYLQAFVSGSLIHVVAFGVTHDHGGHIEPVARSQDWGYRLGILLGLFLVFTAPQLNSL
ncbi:MAG: hypothetical protein KJP16_03055 [Gammaproteobacteria bacterium]|nr:hypothetical protein [Gammaproteobacteria bacterium]NNL49772.1 hypothetical protein [Woeseiaceae bacterium]